MSETTIEIPAEHIDALRQGLVAQRGDARGSAQLERLIAQLGGGAVGDRGARTLTGSRRMLWSALYDALCAATEQLAEDCNEYWRGTVAPGVARAAVATVATRLELLIALGAPPGDR